MSSLGVPSAFYHLPSPASPLLPPASFLLPPASCLLPPASCLLPLASCLLPPASCSCLLPSASCLLPPAFRLPSYIGMRTRQLFIRIKNHLSYNLSSSNSAIKSHRDQCQACRETMLAEQNFTLLKKCRFNTETELMECPPRSR